MSSRVTAERLKDSLPFCPDLKSIRSSAWSMTQVPFFLPPPSPDEGDLGIEEPERKRATVNSKPHVGDPASPLQSEMGMPAMAEVEVLEVISLPHINFRLPQHRTMSTQARARPSDPVGFVLSDRGWELGYR